MSVSKDHINELLEQINSQGAQYILAIFHEEKDNLNDIVDIYSSFNTGHLKKLGKVLSDMEEPKIQSEIEEKIIKRKVRKK